MLSVVSLDVDDRIAACLRMVAQLPAQRTGVRHRVPVGEPAAVEAAVRDLLPYRFSVTGTLDRRLLLAEADPAQGRWQMTDLAGQPHASRAWPAWAQEGVHLDEPTSWNCAAVVSDTAVHRFLRPRVLLVALYHREHFPLPRFSLAISDLARAARATLMGQVRLVDMQLGVDVTDVLADFEQWKPDVVGVSATFGQHDLLVQILDHLTTLDRPPLMVAGGSLTARNELLLLQRYPDLLVARGAGETTIQDVMAHWHGDLGLADVRGIGYRGAPRGGGLTIGTFRRTGAVGNRTQTDIFPELDLLDATFRHRGVAQLETSRGCTNYCSFCPRGHKGVWAGSTPEQLRWILPAMREVFDRHPQISRTLYLVDEEFIGRDREAMGRALAVAQTLHDAGFRWETSCRIDQVVWPIQDRAWHVQRAAMWRELQRRGLRRCLFGVESGVTSILDRFNKETTAEQNALAIRTLSALGVPTRFTYITFDPLMSAAELDATYAFQNRRDLLLQPLPGLSVDEIVDGVRDDDFVRRHAVGVPFYKGISYMLVSMECLIGAAYTRAAQAAGLTRQVRPSMGRVDAVYADWRIGACSAHAQLWVDRNFALDYTLKSLEKVLDGAPRHAIRDARTVLKDAAFHLFGDMLALIADLDIDTPAPQHLQADLLTMMETRIGWLKTRMGETVHAVTGTLTQGDAERLRAEHRRWADTTSWQLINASDPCGT